MTASARGAAPGGAGPWAAFTVCTLVWSSTFLAIRIGNGALDPLWAATLRLVAGAVLLSCIALAARLEWPRGAALRAAVWFGVVDFGVSLALLYWAEKTVPSSVAAILYATIPLCTNLFARAFGLESLRPLKVVGALVGLAGVMVLFSAHLRESFPPLPLAAACLGAVTAALAGVLLKRGSGGSPVAVNAVAHIAGAPFCLLASLVLRERWMMPRSAEALGSLAYLTLVGSVIAFVAFAYLVQRWPVVRTSFIAVLTPVLASVLGAVVAHEHLSRSTIAGAAIVVTGVSLGIAGDRAVRARG